MFSLRWIPVVAALSLMLGACGGDSDSDDPTTAPVATTASQSTSTSQTPLSAGSLATDGICQVTIPDDWLDDGTGRGETALGDRWSLFGSSIADDAGWSSAKDLLKSQVANEEGAEIADDGDQITVVLPDGRGYFIRQRFENRYCEFSVTSASDRAGDVTSLWRSVAASLALIADS